MLKVDRVQETCEDKWVGDCDGRRSWVREQGAAREPHTELNAKWSEGCRGGSVRVSVEQL